MGRKGRIGLAGLSALLIGFGQAAHAVPVTPSFSPAYINITMALPPGTGPVADVSAQGIPGNGLGDQEVFDFLKWDVQAYNNYPNPGSHNLPAPVLAGEGGGDNSTGYVSSLAGYDYAVLHYGKGSGGTGQGGGIVVLYLNGMTGSYNFAANGAGPNGKGGLSFLRLFTSTPGPVPGASVPDGGSTVLLLGLGLAGILSLSRRPLNASA